MSSRSLKQKLALLFPLALLFAVALYFFHLYEPTLAAFLRAKSDVSGKHNSTILTVAGVLLASSLAVLLIRIAGDLVFGYALRLRKDYEAPSIVRNLFSIVAYILILTLVFKIYFPTIELAALVTTSAVFSVIIGLALQDTLGNFFAGISLHADKPFQVGDVITVGAWTGVVETITWRAVKIRTFMDHIVQMDNSSVAKQAFEVCPQNNLNAREIYFSTGYTDAPDRTIRIAQDAVRGIPNISPARAPEVNLIKFGDSSVDYRVKYWLEDYRLYNDTDAVVRQRVWYAMRRAKINFPFPTRTLHIERHTSQDDSHGDYSEFVERLAGVALFAALSNDELERLAASAARHTYTSGEYLIRAGDAGASMFVLHKGAIEVRTSNNNDAPLATLQAGDFFGEMALLRGEPRTANVVACEESEVLEIGYDAMKDLLSSNPALVESLSEVIAERRAKLSENPINTQSDVTESASIIDSIKKFFRL